MFELSGVVPKNLKKHVRIAAAPFKSVGIIFFQTTGSPNCLDCGGMFASRRH